MEDRVTEVKELAVEIKKRCENINERISNGESLPEIRTEICKTRELHSKMIVLQDWCLKHKRKFKTKKDGHVTFHRCISDVYSMVCAANKWICAAEIRFSKREEIQTVRTSKTVDVQQPVESVQPTSSKSTGEARASTSWKDVFTLQGGAGDQLGPALVLFYSEKCGPSMRYLNGSWEEQSQKVARDFPSVKVVTYRCDGKPEAYALMKACGLNSYPSHAFINDQNCSTLQAGSDYQALYDLIDTGLRHY